MNSFVESFLVPEMRKRKMTQTKLAELSGVSRQTINAILSGKSCTHETKMKIVSGFLFERQYEVEKRMSLIERLESDTQ